MIGIVDVGGGLRGIYGSAVFDFCLDHNINFDYLIGVSAGSANVASYLGRQRGRQGGVPLQPVPDQAHAQVDEIDRDQILKKPQRTCIFAEHLGQSRISQYCAKRDRHPGVVYEQIYHHTRG